MFKLPLKRGGLSIGGEETAEMVWPRWLAKLWAKWMGYFWIPCPLCKQPYAGFEWGGTMIIEDERGSVGVGVCAKPECVAAAHKQRHAWHAQRGETILSEKGGLVVISVEKPDDTKPV
jgi:hypothetical protein